MRWNVKLVLGLCLSAGAGGLARADIAFLSNTSDTMLLLSKQNDKLWRASCAKETLAPTIGNCHDSPRETDIGSVIRATEPQFGGESHQFNEQVRQWTVEINRIDAKILELLSTSPNTTDTATVATKIHTVSDKLIELDIQSAGISDQIARLEISLANQTDADALALLAALRTQRVALDAQRQELADQLHGLNEEIAAASATVTDKQTFALVEEQRQSAVKSYATALANQVAEDARRALFEHALAMISDQGFTYRVPSGDTQTDRELLASVIAIERESTAEWTASITPMLDATDPQIAECISGFSPYCGIRGHFTVSVDAHLAGLSCKVVGAITPCHQILAFQADPTNQLIAIDGTQLSSAGDQVDWTPANAPHSSAWTVPAKGTWIVIAKCGLVTIDDEHNFFHYPGRVQCEAKLAAP